MTPYPRSATDKTPSLQDLETSLGFFEAKISSQQNQIALLQGQVTRLEAQAGLQTNGHLTANASLDRPSGRVVRRRNTVTKGEVGAWLQQRVLHDVMINEVEMEAKGTVVRALEVTWGMGGLIADVQVRWFRRKGWLKGEGQRLPGRSALHILTADDHGCTLEAEVQPWVMGEGVGPTVRVSKSTRLSNFVWEGLLNWRRTGQRVFNVIYADVEQCKLLVGRQHVTVTSKSMALFRALAIDIQEVTVEPTDPHRVWVQLVREAAPYELVTRGAAERDLVALCLRHAQEGKGAGVALARHVQSAQPTAILDEASEYDYGW